MLLSKLLLPSDVSKIFWIPLRASDQENKLIWHFTMTGKYHVKFEYLILVYVDDVFANYAFLGEWKKVMKSPHSSKRLRISYGEYFEIYCQPESD